MTVSRPSRRQRNCNLPCPMTMSRGSMPARGSLPFVPRPRQTTCVRHRRRNRGLLSHPPPPRARTRRSNRSRARIEISKRSTRRNRRRDTGRRIERLPRHSDPNGPTVGISIRQANHRGCKVRCTRHGHLRRCHQNLVRILHTMHKLPHAPSVE